MLVNDFNQLSQADSQILHPGTRLLFRHWETVRAERAAPKRDDLDLRHIRALLPNVAIIERTSPGDGFRWRLAGSDVCHLFRRELTGSDALTLGDQFERATIRKLYHSVVTSLQPCLLRYRVTTDTNMVVGVEQVGLPLLDGRESKVNVFGGFFPFNDIRQMSYNSITAIELASARTIWTEHLPGDKLVERLAHPAANEQRLRVIAGGKSS